LHRKYATTEGFESKKEKKQETADTKKYRITKELQDNKYDKIPRPQTI
jgi:hypothetical protein